MKKLKKIIFLTVLILVHTSIIKAQNNIDYLIVIPDILIQNQTWHTDLINLQTSRGFHPAFITVSINNTTAQIRTQIENYYNSNPLKYVLLIGNGKNIPPGDDPSYLEMYLQHGEINNEVDYGDGTYVPFFSVQCSTYWNSNGYVNVATDDPYVEGLTSHGQLYVGRIPVTSAAESINYVSKLQAYYQSMQLYSSAKDREIILNLNVDYPNNGCTGGLVTSLNNQLISQYVPSYVTKVILNVSEHLNGNAFERRLERDQIFEQALNQGASIMSILGTIGGPVNLGSWYWNNSSFNLTNKNISMPFLVAPNCYQGEVTNPVYESTARILMVTAPLGGIIGFIGPTETSIQNANGFVLNRFNELIYQNETSTFGEIFKTLKNELTANYSDFPFMNVGLTFFGDPSMFPSNYKHKSENISVSETWSGNIVVDNTITIENDAVLTILPGTKLFFANTSSLIVNGILNAQGTADKYIVFDFNPDLQGGSNGVKIYSDNATLRYCEIKNAYRGIYVSSANPTIENCDFYHCTDGLHLRECHYYPDMQSGFIFRNNNIHDCAFGINLTASSPLLINNEISNNDIGINCYDGSSPYLGDVNRVEGLNSIKHNRISVYSNASNPVLGIIESYDFGGKNIIDADEYYVYAENIIGTILAENNYWGQSTPEPGKFNSQTEEIDYIPWL